MTFITPTQYKTTGTYTAAADRRVLQTLAGGFEGVVAAGDLAASADSPASLRVSVAAGRALVNGDSVARQGAYLIENDAALLSPYAAAAHATLNRRDLLVARVYDPSPDGGSAGSDSVVLEIVPGTPLASPVIPTLPPNAIPIADLYVAAAATTVSITDRRPKLGPPAPGAVGAVLPLNPVDGQRFLWTPSLVGVTSGSPSVWPVVYLASTGLWHVIGGEPAVASSATGINTTVSASYTATGLAITPPNSGNYDIEVMARGRIVGAVEFGRLSWSGGGVASALADLDGRAAAYQLASNIDVPMLRLYENQALTGNLGVSLDYRSNSAAALTLGFRYLKLKPRTLTATFI